MPAFASSFHPDVDYNATEEYHGQIEDFLARLDAKDPGAAKDTIFRVVKEQRHFKGRAILEALGRAYPGLVRVKPPADEEGETVNVLAWKQERLGGHADRSPE